MARQERSDYSLQFREIAGEIVDRLQPFCCGIDQDLVHPAFGFSGEDRNAHVDRFLEVGHDGREHGEQSRSVKPAEHDLDPSGPEWAGDVEGTRILVRLYADQPHETEVVVPTEIGNDVVNANARVGLIDGRYTDIDIRSKKFPFRSVCGESINGRQRIRWHR